jgi:hypothetical protein
MLMRCLACGAEMRLKQIAEDNTMPVAGFEHHTFKCSACGDVERRLVFTGHFGPRHTDLDPLHAAQAISPVSTVENEGEAAPGVMKRVFAKLSRVCRAVERRLTFDHGKRSGPTVSDPVTPQTSAPPVEPVSAPRVDFEPGSRASPPSPGLAEQFSAPTAATSSISSQADNDLDQCETLLRQAIEIVHGPTHSSQMATRPVEAIPTTPAKLVSSLQAERPSTNPVVVQIYHDPKKGKYVARDTKSGLGVLRHQDSARLRAMCARMGWQIVDGAVASAGK